MSKQKDNITIYFETKEETCESETFSSNDISREDIVRDNGFSIFRNIDGVKTWTWIPYHRIYEIVTIERI